MCLEMSFEGRPGHVIKLPLFIAWIKVDFARQRASACR